jgi:hypothetical protein
MGQKILKSEVGMRKAEICWMQKYHKDLLFVSWCLVAILSFFPGWVKALSSDQYSVLSLQKKPPLTMHIIGMGTRRCKQAVYLFKDFKIHEKSPFPGLARPYVISRPF